MKIYVAAIFLSFAIILFIAIRKRWINGKTMKITAEAATIGSFLVAIATLVLQLSTMPDAPVVKEPTETTAVLNPSSSISSTKQLQVQKEKTIPSTTATLVPQPTDTPLPMATNTFQSDDPYWTTEYYDNVDFLGTPIQTGTDERINFDWGSVSPALGVPEDFAARWTRCLNFENRYYDFYTSASSPDIVKAYIDDTLINRGGSSSFLTPAGRHCLRVDFLDYGYGASVEFDFKPGPAAPVIDPDTAWLGEYFDNNQFEGLPAVTQYDPVIDFDWGEISPAIGIPAEFSVRWTRCLEFEGRQYEFYTSSSTNDPVKVYMDDTLINSGGDSKFLVPAGQHCLRVDYLDFGYGASVEFSFR